MNPGLLTSLVLLLITQSIFAQTASQESLDMTTPETQWHADIHPHRIDIAITPPANLLPNHVAEISLDLNALLAGAGIEDKLNEDSLCLVEVDSTGKALDYAVPHQFNNHRWQPGRLFILLQNTEKTSTKRHYQLYINTGDKNLDTSEDKTSGSPIITCKKDVFDEDQDTFKITTDNATFFYQYQGAGLSSLVDADGNDWIGYHPGNQDQGEWRGIANMGWDGLDADPGFGHPGYDTGNSELIADGPLCVTVRSWSNNGKWEAYWDFYPTHAKLTVTRKPDGRPFWFLYEGTPGGEFNDEDLCVRPSGVTTPLTERWGEPLGQPGEPVTVYFASKSSNRSLFFTHLDSGDHVDSYYKLRTMTVFGFGRGAGKQGLHNYLQKLPNRFIIGLTDSIEYDQVSKITEALSSDIEFTVGDWQNKP